MIELEIDESELMFNMNKNTIKGLLQHFPIFQDLTDYEMEPIIDLAKHHVFRNSSHIFMQGDALTKVYFIYKGRVKIYKTDINGKEQIINILQPKDMFPHQGFFRKDDYPAHAEAIGDTILVYIPIQSFEDFLITHPEICIKLFRVLGDIIVDLQARLGEKILNTTYEQIIMLLLRLVKSHGMQISDHTYKLTTSFNNRELANMIGTSRETVSRTLTQLRKKKCVETDDHNDLIINVQKLEMEVY